VGGIVFDGSVGVLIRQT